MDAGHGNITRPDKVDELIEYMEATVLGILSRLEGEEFTTVQFIEVMLTDPEAAFVYQDAIRRWGEGEHMSKMVLHGQVIPAILRRSPDVEWAGYAHEETDPYGVPAWWVMNEQTP